MREYVRSFLGARFFFLFVSFSQNGKGCQTPHNKKNKMCPGRKGERERTFRERDVRLHTEALLIYRPEQKARADKRSRSPLRARSKALQLYGTHPGPASSEGPSGINQVGDTYSSTSFGKPSSRLANRKYMYLYKAQARWCTRPNVHITVGMHRKKLKTKQWMHLFT